MAEPVEVDCGKQLEIVNVEQLFHSLEEVLQQGAPVSLKVDQVERADTASLQLLVAFRKSLLSQGLDVQLTNPTDSFKHAARLLGLNRSLGL